MYLFIFSDVHMFSQEKMIEKKSVHIQWITRMWMCQFRKVEQKIDTQKMLKSYIIKQIYSKWCQWSLSHSHSIYE